MAGLRIVVAAGALALGLLTAACQSNPEPAPLPSTSPTVSTSSPAPSSSPAATPPTIPAEAQGTSKKSAKAFVRYYVDAINFATTTGNTRGVRSDTLSRCASCVALLDKIDAVYAAGGRFSGDGWTILDIKYQPFQPRTEPVLSVGIRVGAQRMVEKAGSAPEHFKGGRNRLTVTLLWTKPQWKVARLERLA